MTSESAATLRSRYVAQAASDLKENRRLQQELAKRISVLKQEEALLSDILTLAEGYEEIADTPPLPEQLKDEPVVAEAKKTTTTAPRKSTSAKSARAGKATKTAKTAVKGTPQQPLLGDLLADVLGQYEEPRLAKELRDELLEKHPDRNPTPQVVRNTLESLVAKGRIRRHKQQRSVMYTLVKPGESVSDDSSD